MINYTRLNKDSIINTITIQKSMFTDFCEKNNLIVDIWFNYIDRVMKEINYRVHPLGPADQFYDIKNLYIIPIVTANLKAFSEYKLRQPTIWLILYFNTMITQVKLLDSDTKLFNIEYAK